MQSPPAIQDKFDTRMQISIKSEQKEAINRFKPESTSFSEIVRRALDLWLKKERQKQANLDEVIRRVTAPSPAEQKLTNQEIDQWIEDMRRDR